MAELTGRQLDAAIAERCFGFALSENRKRIKRSSDAPFRLTDRFVPSFHKNMAAAWKVAEWIREQTGVFELIWADGSRWACGYMELEGYDTVYEYADTPAEAICRAAVKLAERMEVGE